MRRTGRVEEILVAFCGDVERSLKARLHGFTGMIMKGYLPQVWVFETESETVSVLADVQGKVSVHPGDGLQRDVTIRWHHALMCEVLASRSARSVPEGERPVITYHTSKGSAAFGFVKGRLGL